MSCQIVLSLRGERPYPVAWGPLRAFEDLIGRSDALAELNRADAWSAERIQMLSTLSHTLEYLMLARSN
jgi:hypothetical protein